MVRVAAALTVMIGSLLLGGCGGTIAATSTPASTPVSTPAPSPVSTPVSTPAPSPTSTSPSTPASTPLARPPQQPAYLRVKVLNTYPHAPDAFTQGLFLHDGVFYESAGLYGKSTLRTVDPKTGKVLRRQAVPAEHFAEGLALVGDRLFQLTWQEHVAIVYDADTWARVGEFPYETEGWGLCYDEPRRRLVMSDGSAQLYWRDPSTFQVTQAVTVTLAGQPVARLNELECVGDAIYANVWQTENIVQIDADTGTVTGAIDATGLLAPSERAGTDVLNGIAYDEGSGHFFITGKLWPKIFEVDFVPAGP